MPDLTFRLASLLEVDGVFYGNRYLAGTLFKKVRHPLAKGLLLHTDQTQKTERAVTSNQRRYTARLNTLFDGVLSHGAVYAAISATDRIRTAFPDRTACCSGVPSSGIRLRS